MVTFFFGLFVDVVISEKAGKSSSAESHSSNEPHVPVSEVSHKCNDNHVIENWSLRILKQESHYHHKQMTKLTFRVLALCQRASLFGRYSLKEATGQISNNSIAQAQVVESADNTISVLDKSLSTQGVLEVIYQSLERVFHQISKH